MFEPRYEKLNLQPHTYTLTLKRSFGCRTKTDALVLLPATLRLSRHFPCNDFNHVLDVLQFLYDCVLKSILMITSLSLEETVKHLSDEPAKRTVLWNGVRMRFCCICFYHIRAW